MGEAAIDKAARAKAIMIQGTASGVGKTMLTIALCRIFAEDGFRVAPFKPQNMTANTALTAKGDEIAVSQFLQALAQLLGLQRVFQAHAAEQFRGEVRDAGETEVLAFAEGVADLDGA